MPTQHTKDTQTKKPSHNLHHRENKKKPSLCQSRWQKYKTNKRNKLLCFPVEMVTHPLTIHSHYNCQNKPHANQIISQIETYNGTLISSQQKHSMAYLRESTNQIIKSSEPVGQSHGLLALCSIIDLEIIHTQYSYIPRKHHVANTKSMFTSLSQI